MTAAGLAVAIPAVLAFNIFGKMVAACEAELEGFAHDLREMASECRAMKLLRVTRVQAGWGPRPARADVPVGPGSAMSFGRLERSPARSR